LKPDDSGGGEERLPRHLTFGAVLFLMLNGIVGAGIFGMPQDVSRLAGDAGVWMFPLCALLILPVILVFVSLGSRFSGTGGPMLYVGATFGPFAGFQTGWAFYVARLTAFAANINLLLTTLAWFWPELGGSILKAAMLLLIIGSLTLLNIRSPRGTIGALGFLTLAKFLPLIGIVGVGLLVMPEAAPMPAPTEIDIGAAALLVIYAYVGFESGLVPGGESQAPKKDIPRALLAALFISAALYTGLYLVCDRLLPDLVATPQPVVAAGEVLLGSVGAVILTAVVAASVLGNLMGAQFSTPRVTWRMATEGQLPPILARLDPHTSMPAVSIVLFAALAFLLAASGSFVWLASISVVVRVLIYLACVATLQRMRDVDGINLPGGFLIPAVAITVCLYLLAQASLTAWLTTAGLLLAGSLLWALARGKPAG